MVRNGTSRRPQHRSFNRHCKWHADNRRRQSVLGTGERRLLRALGASRAYLLTIGTVNYCDVMSEGTAVGVLDVQQIINEALGLAPASNDLNGDGVVNVADVQIVIGAAMGLGCLGN